MQKNLDYINKLGLTLTQAQLDTLNGYVELVWQKKNDLNLTSVAGKQEIWTRHIIDGLNATAIIKKEGKQNFTAADLGSGAGYIGIAIGVALPECEVTLVESLERRCAFMRWVILKLGIKNIKVVNIRAGEGAHDLYDFVTERAMGKIEDILGICMGFVKEGGKFLAYQTDATAGTALGGTASAYTLPEDDKTRHIVVFTKHGNN
ncbi:16S rRNA (guanine527-N7)-methyltransferase [Elusimicrobium posterum]|uniref:16S rRNA (guanine(527)-N(7))-methyltransferase RsmG n=1 Tax=Elusimicrobium posterum TaxID=3116653 RepID=UPI003C769529